MTERVCGFGPDGQLAGVLTEPEGRVRRPELPAIIWLNAGVLHSVGPFGWYTTLARRFAEQGVVSLRFDVAGVGDSAPRGAGGSNLESGQADVQAAMRFLERECGTRRFVLIGLCSGAVLAQHMAAADERVTGAVLLDGWGYRTRGFYLRHYRRRLFRLHSWLNAAGRLFSGQRARKVPIESGEGVQILNQEFYFDFPGLELGRRQLAAATAHGANLLFLFTGDVEKYFNDRRQFAEMCGPEQVRKGLEVEYWKEADHLFSERNSRRVLFRKIEEWFQRTQAEAATAYSPVPDDAAQEVAR